MPALSVGEPVDSNVMVSEGMVLQLAERIGRGGTRQFGDTGSKV
ncbi:MAG: hypothetical protein WBB00_05275 [Mycobacterium sp.]